MTLSDISELLSTSTGATVDIDSGGFDVQKRHRTSRKHHGQQKPAALKKVSKRRGAAAKLAIAGSAVADKVAAPKVSRIPAAKPAKKTRRLHNIHEYTLGEEVANAVTHGIGAGLAVASIPLVIVKAVSDGGGILLFAGLMYTIIMLLEYLMSTLYHALAPEKAKRVFKVLDHSFIYLYIAASYTPFCLVTLAPVGGWGLFWAVWIVAMVGVLCEAFWVFRPRWISAVLYVAMGWLVLWYLPYLIGNLPVLALWLLVIGGFCYTAGAVLYVLKKVKYMHSVFHFFVLAGSCFQFFSIFFFVI